MKDLQELPKLKDNISWVVVGNVNARVRGLLWQRICISAAGKGAVMVYSSSTEQGFTMTLAGTPKRSIVDLDGIQLVKIE